MLAVVISTNNKENKTYSFNGAESAKLSFQVGLFGFITETSNKESPKWVTSSLGIFVRIVCKT